MSVSLFPVALFLAQPPAAVDAPPSIQTPVLVEPQTTAPVTDVAEPPLPAPPAAPAPATDPKANTAETDAIIVTARPKIAADPLVEVNAVTFSTMQSVDGALVEPVSMAYKKAVPSPVRSGVRNILDNLAEPVVFVNYLLQLKPGKAAETLGRFAVNSTIGVAGLFDVAKKKPFNLPRRPNGFAYTMGYYGVKPGAFLYLPLIGPTTVRDLIGRMLDIALLPTTLGRPFNQPLYSVTTTAIRSMDDRILIDEQIRSFKSSADPYAAMRASYLSSRQAEIDALRGIPKAQKPAPAVDVAP